MSNIKTYLNITFKIKAGIAMLTLVLELGENFSVWCVWLWVWIHNGINRNKLHSGLKKEKKKKKNAACFSEGD